jgi:hypothetical protein
MTPHKGRFRSGKDIARQSTSRHTKKSAAHNPPSATATPNHAPRSPTHRVPETHRHLRLRTEPQPATPSRLAIFASVFPQGSKTTTNKTRYNRPAPFKKQGKKQYRAGACHVKQRAGYRRSTANSVSVSAQNRCHYLSRSRVALAAMCIDVEGLIEVAEMGEMATRPHG